MRVAHVGVEIVPSRGGAFVGGLVKSVATLAHQQVASGYDVDIFTTDVRGVLARDEMSTYGRVRRVEALGGYASVPFALSFLRRAAAMIRNAHRRQPYDVVHLHSAYASLGALGILLRSMEAPKVFGLYAPNFRPWPGHSCNDRSRTARKFTTGRFLNSFDAVVVPSRSLASMLRSLRGRQDGVLQIPPALSPTMFEPHLAKTEAREALGLPRENPIVLYLGNYSPWKGIEVLLDAMSLVRKEVPKATLLTAWGEPYKWAGNRRESVLASVRTHGLEGALRQVGILEDVRLALRAADVLASPFQCTCKVLDYPLSVLEAMACERPVVSTTVGGIPELLGEGERGFLVGPRDAVGLAQSILRILRDDRMASEMGMNGARWAHQHCTPERICSEVEAEYVRLTSTSGGLCAG